MGTFTQADNWRLRLGENKDDILKPILTPDNSIVPGQVIVQLHQATAGAITSNIGRSPALAATASSAKSFGVTALDKALSNLKVTSITRLHPPSPPAFAPSVGALAAIAEPMASTFRIDYAASTTVDKVVESLSTVEGVEMVEAIRYRETLTTTPNDPQFPSQWGLRRIHCPEAWDRSRGSNSIVVAVIDTGVDLDHPELAPLLVPGRDLVNLGVSPTPPPGFHFEGDINIVDNDPMDEVGHGTHVAGTIACLSNNATGVAGVTWQCRIMPVRVLARIVNNNNPADVRGTGSSADIAAGIRWAVDHGARVINLSLGGPSDTFVERDAIAYAIAHGVVVCAAMGNGGAGAPISFPAAYSDVVAVAAIDSSDHRASFSQTGPHIDVSGPGVGILSTVWDNSFTTMSGTSMATPHVAGVAALILSINPSLTAAECADILRQTADPLRDNPGDPIPNNNYGWGCVNALAALNRASPPVSAAIVCHLTNPITCQKVPSLQIICDTTNPITCRNSLLIAGCQNIPTLQLNCSRQIICHQVSTLVVCPTNTFGCTTSIVCHISNQVPCQTSNLACPSRPICDPGSNRCGDPGFPGEGGLGMTSELGSDDPYAPDYGIDQSR